MSNVEASHGSEILDQFSRQAKTFSSVPAHTAEDPLVTLTEALQVTENDVVLDAACGPGIVTTWLARVAKHITGTDLVPAMLERSRSKERELGLRNVEWQIADICDLPYPDETFSLVVTRYSFHHLLDPRKALQEMMRVCSRGGRIAVVDVTPEENKTAAYDSLEKQRDPSHAHALSLAELTNLGQGEPLELVKTQPYTLEISLDAQLAASFPKDGDANSIREKVRKDIGVNELSVDAFIHGDEVMLRLPISIVVWKKQ